MGDSSGVKPPTPQSFKPKFRGQTPLLIATGLLTFTIAQYYLIRPSSKPKSLDPYTYSPALVTSHQHPTPHTSLIRLRLRNPGPPPEPFYAVWIKSPQVQIEREYTPLRGLEGERGDEIELWVKREHAGEVSRYLGTKKAGEEIEVRGWTRGVEWVDKGWDEVVMVSGGTGITPFYQLMHHLFLRAGAQPPNKTHFTLLHGSPTPADLPPSSILGSLAALQQQHPNRFSLRLFVDSLSPGQQAVHEQAGHSLPLTIGRVRPEDLALAADPSAPQRSTKRGLLSYFFPSKPEPPTRAKDKKVLFLVCGPEPMVEALAGPRARDLTEGEVGGVLGGMGYKKGEVRKL